MLEERIMKTKPEKVYQLVDPDTWEVVGEITRKELVKKYGAGNQGTITKVGRLLLADKEGIKL